MNFKKSRSNLLLVLGSGLAAALISSSRADAAAGTVPPDVQTAIDNTTATVAALSPVAIAGVAAALIPFGSSMALSFVHKVMSKA